MEQTIMEQLEAVFTPEVLDGLCKVAEAQTDQRRELLKESALKMPNAELNIKLIDYCSDAVKEYIARPDNMMKVLTDTKNIEGIYAEMTAADTFKELASKEAMGLPRILSMTILTGTESNACQDALELLPQADEAVRAHLERMAATYEKFMKDALSYGTGNKTVNVMGTD